jgi:MFS family permease
MPDSSELLPSSAWRPLFEPIFRALWIASLASNVGTWMQNVAGTWLMTSLSSSPVMVALMQTATSLPIFLLALPAGALADVVDRRRLLLITQAWMLIAAALLGILTLFGTTRPWILLSLTFLLGLGAAANAPAWQAIVSELVPKSELPAAVALNSLGFNAARAIGPALGGVVVAIAGAGAVFLLNAMSFFGVVIVLFYWQRPIQQSLLPAERTIGAVRTGIRYVRNAPVLHAVLLRSSLFIMFGTAFWALLPLLVRYNLKLGPAGYGMLLGVFGFGAVAGAAVLPHFRQKVSIDKVSVLSTALYAAGLIILAFLHNMIVVCMAIIIEGAAWLILLSSYNTIVQTVVPSWVRGRALAVYLFLFFGGMAAGSILWGAVAAHVGTNIALFLAALGLVASLIATRSYLLPLSDGLNLEPSMDWPAPIVAGDLHLEDGPVLVTIEYRIDPERSKGFASVMYAVGRIRKRDGAVRWALFGDTAIPGRYIETFIVESWADHLRQHERVSVADREIFDHIQTYTIGDARPAVSHFIYAYGVKARD